MKVVPSEFRIVHRPDVLLYFTDTALGFASVSATVTNTAAFGLLFALESSMVIDTGDPIDCVHVPCAMRTLNEAPAGMLEPSSLRISHLAPLYDTAMGWLFATPADPTGL